MEQIGQIIIQKSNVYQQSQTELANSSRKTEIVKEYGQASDFLLKFNPDIQVRICHNTDLCIFGNYPTLAKLNWYGKQMAKTWLMIQLTDLSEYCGCKDKLSGNALEQCSAIIAQRFYYLKISEIMLFLYRFKAGDYGRFYGSIDPLVITTAINSFIIDRNILIDKHEQKLRDQRDAIDRANSITYEQWIAKHKQKK